MQWLFERIESEVASQNGTPFTGNNDFDFLFIGELAERFGLNPKTIRFYESAGLLEPARHGKFRTFKKADAVKLNFILTLRRLGLSIAAIKPLLTEALNPVSRVDGVLREHLESLKKQKQQLEQQFEETNLLLEKLSGN